MTVKKNMITRQHGIFDAKLRIDVRSKSSTFSVGGFAKGMMSTDREIQRVLLKFIFRTGVDTVRMH